MALINRNNGANSDRPVPARSTGFSQATGPSILGADLSITGDLVTKGEVQINGTVKGTVVAERLTVGESAQIEGSLEAERVRIHGTLNGRIKAGTVSLANTAKVTGDVVHKSLEIEGGAFIDGKVQRSDAAKAGTQTPSLPGAIVQRADKAEERDRAETPKAAVA